jgi:cysteinyl-tRNA synthetase
MELKLYDTLTKEKRVFAPLDPSNVRMYVCGPTVYDFAHIGNARPVIVFDVLFRLLRHLYGEAHVTYVRNITDVDDKINDRAARDFPGMALNDAIRKVTEKTANQFHADVAALGCLPPTHEPRATEHIAEMIDIIGMLLENGYAYIALGKEGREVLFEVAKMKRYGELSNRKLDEQIEGARIAVEVHKKNPADFILWKESSPSEPGWPAKFKADYPTNTGEVEIYGRPGWHIECSAMSWKYLGKTFDIHGGGIDLVFPHHENELAQSCCAFHTDRMAQTWMHNGFLQIEGEKMSKSLGNFVTINELLKDWPGEVVRFNMLKTHYRSPIDWTVKGLEQSFNELRGLTDFDEFFTEDGNAFSNSVLDALCDDLNTSKAIAELHTLYRSGDLYSVRRSLRGLGILNRPESKRQVDHAKVGELLDIRLAARARKDFAESDRIRDELAAMGVAIKDGKDADGKPVTTWEIAR